MTETDMGSDQPETATRSNRRRQRVTIVGVLALIVIAGTVLVGVKSNGARSASIAM